MKASRGIMSWGTHCGQLACVHDGGIADHVAAVHALPACVDAARTARQLAATGVARHHGEAHEAAVAQAAQVWVVNRDGSAPAACELRHGQHAEAAQRHAVLALGRRLGRLRKLESIFQIQSGHARGVVLNASGNHHAAVARISRREAADELM